MEYKAQLLSIDEIASLVLDTRENIIEFIRKDRIPYAVCNDGIIIPLGGFQCCMNKLYDLEGALAQLFDRMED
jgi:hypothetical protein